MSTKRERSIAVAWFLAVGCAAETPAPPGDDDEEQAPPDVTADQEACENIDWAHLECPAGYTPQWFSGDFVVLELEDVDVVHDALARAVHGGVVAERAYALAEKRPAVTRARRAEEWLAKLFPEGLAIINASHLAESGNTARIAKLLEREPELAAFLEAIPVQGHGTLLAVAQRWIAAGKQLAKLEEQREEIEADDATTPLSKEAITRLRARWIRLVSQVLSVLELSDADPKAIALVRRPILKASARAAKRYDAPNDAAEALAEGEGDEGEEGDEDEEDDASEPQPGTAS